MIPKHPPGPPMSLGNMREQGVRNRIRLNDHIEGADGAVVFRAACNMGLEGIVAKRRDSRYRSGRCRDWIKIKNMAHPAIQRAMLIALTKRRRPG